MYEQYWGLTSAPFVNRVSGEGFYESPIHEEALARLLYCVEHDKALAVLHGPRGCGKTQLLHLVAEQVRRTQRFLAMGNLAQLSEQEFLWELEGQLRLGGSVADSLGTRWRRLRDFFLSTAQSGIQTVILLDGLERAENSALSAIRRLVELHGQRSANITLVLCMNQGLSSPGVKELLELADMGIEVKPLEREDTEHYIQKRLETAGGTRAVFEAEAIDPLQQFTGGIPREINRLCDLALLAGMNDNQTAIDKNLIVRLSEEYQRT